MKHYTRRDIFELRDESLINYYDRCIDEFKRLNKKYDNLFELMRQSEKLEGRSNVIFLALVLVGGMAIYQIIHLIFDYSRLKNDDMLQLSLIRQDWIIMAVLVVFLIVIVVYNFTRRRTLKRQAEEARNKYLNLDKSIQGEITHAKGNLKNAYVLFSGPQDLNYVRMLHDMVFQGRARSHQEAANLAYDEIHHMEDCNLKRELVSSINRIADKMGSDPLNKVAQGANIISGIKPTWRIAKWIAKLWIK